MTPQELAIKLASQYIKDLGYEFVIKTAEKTSEPEDRWFVFAREVHGMPIRIIVDLETMKCTWLD